MRHLFSRRTPRRQLARSVRTDLGISIACGFAAIGFEAASLKLFGQLTDDVLTPRRFDAFAPIAAAYIMLSIALIAVDYLGTMRLTRATQRYVRATRTGLFSRILSAPRRVIDRHDDGDLLTRLDSDVEIAESGAVSGVHSGATAAFQVALFTVMLAWLDPLLAGVCLLFAPLGFVAARVVSGRIAVIEAESRELAGDLMDRAAQALDAHEEVSAFQWQSQLTHEFDEDGAAAERAALRATRASTLLQGLNHVLEMVAALVVIGIGVWQLSRGDVSLGTLLAFLAFLLELFGPLSDLSHLVTTFTTARVSAERLDDIAPPPALSHSPHAVPLPALSVPPAPAPSDATAPHPQISSVSASPAPRGESGPPLNIPSRHACTNDLDTYALGAADAPGGIQFHDVTYTHPGHDHPTIRHLDLHVPRRRIMAVTGPSGSGKSTILRLASGALTPESGYITRDGRTLVALDADLLAATTSLVPQRPTLFSESVVANVRRAAPSCTDAQLQEALDAAGVTAFAERLPHGLETFVGPAGRHLSGGQRQRIALARALLRPSAVLVLDEPTTGLDAESAGAFIATLRTVSTGRTVLLATHDTTLANAADVRIELTASSQALAA